MHVFKRWFEVCCGDLWRVRLARLLGRTGLLVFLLVATVWGARVADLKLGDADKPKTPVSPIEIVADEEGSYTIGVTNGLRRLIQITERPEGVDVVLHCAEGSEAPSQKSVEPNTWILAVGKCEFRILSSAATRAAETPLSLKVAAIPASKLPARSYDKLAPDGVFPVTLRLRAARAGAQRQDKGPRPPTDQGPTQSLRDQLGSDQIVLFSLVALAVLLATGGAYWIYVRFWPGKKEDEWLGQVARTPSAAGGPGAVLPTEARGGPRPRSATPDDSPSALQLRRLQESVSALESLPLKLDAMERSLRPELERKLEQYHREVENLFDARMEEALASTREANRQIQSDLAELRSQVATLETRWGILQQKAHRGLQDLLLDLPLTPFDASPGTEDQKLLVAKHLEKAVSRYLSGNAPSPETLQPFLDQADRLQQAVTRFQEEAFRIAPPQTEAKLAPILGDLKQVREELNGFLAGSSEHRLRLNFAVDFSTLADARQTLGQSIAAGVETEIVKLDNVPDYYTKRLVMLASRAAAEAADFADAALDPDRNNGRIQAALQDIFDAGQMEQIVPRRNDPFVGRDHNLLQMTSRTSPGDRSGAVAQLAARGFRHGSRVIRKASVIVFD